MFNNRYVLNAAVMPAGCYGLYFYRPVAPQMARRWGQIPFVSRVGYDSTAKFLTRLLGIPVPVSRRETVLMPGDEALVCRLRYRLNDPRAKGLVQPADEDWELAWLLFIGDTQALARRAGLDGNELSQAVQAAQAHQIPLELATFLVAVSRDEASRELYEQLIIGRK